MRTNDARFSSPVDKQCIYAAREQRRGTPAPRAWPGVSGHEQQCKTNDEILEAAGVAAFLIAKAVDALFGSLPKGTDPETMIKALSLHLMAYAEGQSSVRFLSDALLARQALRELGVNVGKTGN